MAAALKRERIDLLHVIGPQTKHAIHPDSKVEIGRRMNELAAKGRQRFPKVIDFQTYTLKYNRMHWITVDGLNAHWDETTVHAERSDSEFKVATKNATAISIHLPSGAIDDLQSSWGVVIDGQNVGNFHAKSDGSLHLSFQQTQGEWKFGSTELKQSALLRKVHNLQGPIDDAFMDSFIFVAPDRTGDDSAMNQWVKAELKHASEQWRQQFRGDARVRLASEITDEEIRNANLVLFGTPRSNTLIEKIERELPITWDTSALNVGSRTFDSAYHIPLLIYPNPLNRSRYVVMNSGFTYREYAYLNNARQVPMLPDWAIVDIRTPPTSQYPGKVVAADFFDEDWKLKPSSSESSN